MAAGLYRLAEPKLVNRVVVVDGHYLNCVTNGRVQDGKMMVRISHMDLWPIREKFTLSSFGAEYRDVNYLDYWVDSSEVLTPVSVHSAYDGWKYTHKKGQLPELSKGKLLWPITFGPMPPWWMTGKPGTRTFTSQE